MIRTILTSAALAIALAAPASADNESRGGGFAKPMWGHVLEGAEADRVLDELGASRGGGARVSQNGRKNAAGIRQGGRRNDALVHQQGSGHTGTVRQRGRDNRFGLIQLGRNTTAHAVQTGRGKSTVLILEGW